METFQSVTIFLRCLEIIWFKTSVYKSAQVRGKAGYLPSFFRGITTTPSLCCKADNHIGLSLSFIPVGIYSESLTSSFLTPLQHIHTHTHMLTHSLSPPSCSSHLVSLWVLRFVFLGDTTELLVQMTTEQLFCGLPQNTSKLIGILF